MREEIILESIEAIGRTLYALELLEIENIIKPFEVEDAKMQLSIIRAKLLSLLGT
jgi:hypothetical protein